MIRALSLVASRDDMVLRPWYAPSTYAANANTSAPHAETCVDNNAQCAVWATLTSAGVAAAKAGVETFTR